MSFIIFLVICFKFSMKTITMNTEGKDSSVQVKIEPMSLPGAIPSTSASITKYPVISVKKELGGRLASFQPPRDLSLTDSSSPINSYRPLIKAQPSLKKVFAPNVNVTRRKGVNAPVTNDLKLTNLKTNYERVRKTPRGKGNFVQTQGVFSEGLARAQPREYMRGSDSIAPQMEKPKLNLNRNTTKSKEDIKMKEILRDDFIDDPNITPDLNDCPMSLPLLLQPKRQCGRDLDATFESLQVKTEKSLGSGDSEYFTSPKILKLFQDTRAPKLLAFEFPDEIMRRENDKKTFKEIKQEKNSTEPIFKEVSHRLSNLGEGLWGILKILENGTAYIAVGNEKVPVQLIRHCPKQSVMAVELETIVNLGRLSGSFTCSSELNFSTKMK